MVSGKSAGSHGPHAKTNASAVIREPSSRLIDSSRPSARGSAGAPPRSAGPRRHDAPLARPFRRRAGRGAARPPARTAPRRDRRPGCPAIDARPRRSTGARRGCPARATWPPSPPRTLTRAGRTTMSPPGRTARRAAPARTPPIPRAPRGPSARRTRRRRGCCGGSACRRRSSLAGARAIGIEQQHGPTGEPELERRPRAHHAAPDDDDVGAHRGRTVPSPRRSASARIAPPNTTSDSPTPRCVTTTRPAAGRWTPSISASPSVIDGPG